MKKFEGILFTTDLDGTLLRNDKSISGENLEAIEYFKDNGGYFSIVTGRAPMIVGDIYNAVRPNAPFGCLNGGGVYDGNRAEYMWTCELSRKALKLVEYVDKNLPDMAIQICGFKNCYFSKMNAAMVRHRDSADFPDLRRHYHDVEEPIAKVLFAHEEEERLFTLRDMLNAQPLASEFDFIRSDPEYYEILPKGISKGNLLIKIAGLTGIDKTRTIAIGDNDNDVSMLRSAAVGVAVANASSAAKDAADIVTVSNEENAIAKIIEDLDSGKIIF